MLDSEDGKIGEDAHALCCPKHGNQDVHDDQEEEWGQGVPLPKPTAVEESFPGASIDEHPGGRRPEQQQTLPDPAWAETALPEDAEKEGPRDDVEGLGDVEI
jgi:hypothetical protein